ncbi:MAG: MFS transporter [Nitrososphaeria archaeon]|nr:MFS transporter [Conexivisphaerales archaeon]
MSELIEKAKIGKMHVYTFIAVSMGFFIWGMLSTFAPISTLISKFIPSTMYVFVLSVPLVFALIGNFLMGFIADKIGRKMAFIITMLSYGVGVFLFIISENLAVLMASLFLTQFGVGGEEPALLALLSENMPVRYRGAILGIMPNFANIGAAVASGIAILTQGAFYPTKVAIGVTAFIAIVILVFSRLSMPESVRWLEIKGKTEEAKKYASSVKAADEKLEEALPTASLRFRFAFLAIIGISQFLSFGLMAYILGPAEFPSLTAQILFVANIGASVAGFIGAYIVNGISRKKYILFSFLGGLITMFLILPFASTESLALFYALLFLNMTFSEFAWISRTVLEPELFPTGLRAGLIGVIRTITYGTYIASIYITFNFTVSQYIYYNIGLWLLGFFGALMWYFRGFDTNKKSLKSLDKI